MASVPTSYFHAPIGDNPAKFDLNQMHASQKPLPDLKGCDVTVEVVEASAVDAPTRKAWHRLRASNSELWSPYFDIRMFDVLARLAPHPKLAIVRRDGAIVALPPFQGSKNGLARPLGAPLSDQHSLIQATDGQIELSNVIKATGMSGFVFSGLRHEVKGALKVQKSMCHVADLSNGLDAYVA